METTHDFDALVVKAKTDSNPENLNSLYRAFFHLAEWIFIVKPSADNENPRPFIGILEGQPWAFIFTDTKHADDFARREGFLTTANNSLTIKMSVASSMEFLNLISQKGAYGIRINEGDHGWFCPIQNLHAIAKHVAQ